ncbi:MAG: DnaJ domain-containing protein [Kofleriaceae bacterium]|nr:DnaJ domain-containing protein [Kofleriaceae bacterium]MCL4226683.1 J domain-containing protein [Myxococcales bacterium]
MDPILDKLNQARRSRRAMSWSVPQLMAWLHEVEPIADRRSKFDWLEIPPTASASAIQEAYHQVARSRHPDLFRARLTPEVMDRLVRMYARVTAAYADLKEPERCAAYLRELRSPSGKTAPPPAPPGRGRPSTIPVSPTSPPPLGARTSTIPPVSAPQPIPESSAHLDPAKAMNPRALELYRQVEEARRRGDKGTAVLHLKMAIAADPRSTFLRAALLELMRS